VAFISAKSESPLDFQAVVACLTRHFPGTEVIDQDYAASIVRQVMAKEQQTDKGNKNPLFEQIKQKAKLIGPTWRIVVSLSKGLQLRGTVSKHAVMLSTMQPVELEVFFALQDALAEIQGLESDIGGLPLESAMFTEYIRLRRKISPIRRRRRLPE
jgi:hypothetical protein